MKIGVPRALLYYYYFPLWKTLFENVGIEVVVSDISSKEIVDNGVKQAVPEICVPIKLYIGHILNLLQKGVDFIFVPRFTSIQKGEFFCPKFMGLPDMIRHSIPQAENKIIDPYFTSVSDDICTYNNFSFLEDLIGISPKVLKSALKQANHTWKIFRGYSKQGYSILDSIQLSLGFKDNFQKINSQNKDINIGLIGYVYDIYDNIVSMNIIDKLKSMDVDVTTFEMLDEQLIQKEIKPFKKRLFWTFSNKLLGAAYHFYKNDKYDGIIQVTAFGCGPDSLIGKMLELDSDKFGKPFMTIRVDEHGGESHMLTRAEAFVDMIRRKKIKKLKGA